MMYRYIDSIRSLMAKVNLVHYRLSYSELRMRSIGKKLKEILRGMGIEVVGFAPVSGWDTDPLVSSRVAPVSRPRSIMKNARSVIVIGIPISPATLGTAPSIAYSEAYKVINTMLDQSSQRVTMELMALGYDAMPIPRDGYHGLDGLRESPAAFFSHRHAAYLAGLGTFGENNMLLSAEYGPGIRYTSILTDAELPYDYPLCSEVCIHCGLCVRTCPEGALTRGSYPDNITDKSKCIERSAELNHKGVSPCGMCIAVCPIGKTYNGIYQTAEALERIRSYQRK